MNSVRLNQELEQAIEAAMPAIRRASAQIGILFHEDAEGMRGMREAVRRVVLMLSEAGRDA